MAKVLELIFKNRDGKSKTISIANPKAEVSKAEAEEAMQAVITANVFTHSDADLVLASKAQFRTTTIEELK